MPRIPALAPRADATVATALVVDHWADTSRLPADAERRASAGSWLPVPVGLVIGAAIAATAWLLGQGGGARVLLGVGLAAFVVAWVVLALALVPVRLEPVVHGISLAAWTSYAALLPLATGVPAGPAVAIVAVGATGQLVATRRLHGEAAARHRAVRRVTADGVRSEGWVVAAAGPPWERVLSVELAERPGTTLAAVHRNPLLVRPRRGHPVGVWRDTDDGSAWLVLVPRRPS